MKKTFFKAALVAGFATATALPAMAISFHYSSTIGTPSAAINFDGSSHFSFSADGNGNMFQISSGAATGAYGYFDSTSYTIGAITTVAGVSSATVSGVGSLTINDGSGFSLTATLTWLDLVQSGTSSALNLNGTVNLTGITYGGSNVDLLALANGSGGNGSDVLNFTFSPAVSLADLKSGAGAHSTTFSGSISNVPDGGTTVMLLGAGLSCLGLIRRKLVA